MGEGVDAELEGFEAGREIFDAVELVSPGALGAFDVAVELGPLRRQDEEAQGALSGGVLELRPELRPAIDLATAMRPSCRRSSPPAGQKVKGRKRQVMVDTDGRGLILEPQSADIQDRDGAPLVLADLLVSGAQLRGRHHLLAGAGG